MIKQAKDQLENNPEAGFESRLRGDRVGMDRKKHMGVKTNETVTEVSPAMHYFRVHDIMEQLTAGFERLSTKERIAQAQEVATEAGVTTDTSEMEASIAKPTTLETHSAEAGSDQEKAVYDYLHRLAEDIVDALNKHKRSVAVIEADSIGERTTSKLGMRGDVNFIINEQAGQELVDSLENQHNPMRVFRKNEYGFVLLNKKLGTRFVFVYQEGLGGPKSERKPQGDSGYQDLDTIPEPSAKETTAESASEAASDKPGAGTPDQSTEPAADQQPTPEERALADLESRRAAVRAKAMDRPEAGPDELGGFTIDPKDQKAA